MKGLIEPITFKYALSIMPRYLENKAQRERDADTQWMNEFLIVNAQTLKNGEEIKAHNVPLYNIPALRTAFPEFTITEYNSYPAIGIQLKTKQQ